MTVNVAELRRVQRHIHRYPEKHDQRAWICDTTACVAGRVVLLNGWRPVWESHGEASQVYKDGHVRSVHEVASDILGLAPMPALFYCKERQVDTIIDELCAGAQ